MMPAMPERCTHDYAPSGTARPNNIRSWIKNWNQTPRPFTRTKTADDIPEQPAHVSNESWRTTVG
jgi:hypothetical protein